MSELPSHRFAPDRELGSIDQRTRTNIIQADQYTTGEEAAAKKASRSFKKYQYRGVELDQLLDMSNEKFIDVSSGSRGVRIDGISADRVFFPSLSLYAKYHQISINRFYYALNSAPGHLFARSARTTHSSSTPVLEGGSNED